MLRNVILICHKSSNNSLIEFDMSQVLSCKKFTKLRIQKIQYSFSNGGIEQYTKAESGMLSVTLKTKASLRV